MGFNAFDVERVGYVPTRRSRQIANLSRASTIGFSVPPVSKKSRLCVARKRESRRNLMGTHTLGRECGMSSNTCSPLALSRQVTWKPGYQRGHEAFTPCASHSVFTRAVITALKITPIPDLLTRFFLVSLRDIFMYPRLISFPRITQRKARFFRNV